MVIHETAQQAANEGRVRDDEEFKARSEPHRALAKVLHGVKRLKPTQRVGVLLMALAIVRGEKTWP